MDLSVTIIMFSLQYWKKIDKFHDISMNNYQIKVQKVFTENQFYSEIHIYFFYTLHSETYPTEVLNREVSFIRLVIAYSLLTSVE